MTLNVFSLHTNERKNIYILFKILYNKITQWKVTEGQWAGQFIVMWLPLEISPSYSQNYFKKKSEEI